MILILTGEERRK